MFSTLQEQKTGHSQTCGLPGASRGKMQGVREHLILSAPIAYLIPRWPPYHGFIFPCRVSIDRHTIGLEVGSNNLITASQSARAAEGRLRA